MANGEKPPPENINKLERIQSEFEAAFCPPLDPSLVAALVSELEPASDPNALESLRLTLRDLADDASITKALNEECQITQFEKLSVDDDSTLSGAQTSGSLLRDTGKNTPGTSEPSSDTGLFDTPLGFLRTVFPHLPVSTLRHAIKASGFHNGSAAGLDDFNMGLLVESVLSEEFLREEQERATSTSSDENGISTPEAEWSLVEKKEKRKSRAGTYDISPPAASLKPRKAKAATVPLVDLLQRQHAPPLRPSVDFHVAPDPWSHLASLASSLSQLIPEMPEGKWLALFHNPAYPTPSHAVRAELQRWSLLNPATSSTDTLNFLLEVLGVTEGDEAASRKRHDAEVCLRACHNNAENALDLFRLLEEMDLAGAAIVHSAPSSRPFTPTLDVAASPAPSQFVQGPKQVPRSPILSAPPSPAPPQTQARRIPPRPEYQWQTVAPRKPAAPEQHPLAAHIPAYRIPEPSNGKKKGRPTPSFRKETEITPAPPVPPGLSELEKCRWWMKELRRQRDEAVRAAGRHWRAGTTQDRGGDVAAYYAEEGRRLEEQSREWAVRAARLQVQQQQDRNNDLYTIDLHGLTLHEALHVVKEGVNAWYSSSGSGYAPNHSLTIITGLGKHSAGQQSVLGPAVYKALEKDGWRVVKRPATVVVTGVARG